MSGEIEQGGESSPIAIETLGYGGADLEWGVWGNSFYDQRGSWYENEQSLKAPGNNPSDTSTNMLLWEVGPLISARSARGTAPLLNLLRDRKGAIYLDRVLKVALIPYNFLSILEIVGNHRQVNGGGSRETMDLTRNTAEGRDKKRGKRTKKGGHSFASTLSGDLMGMKRGE